MRAAGAPPPAWREGGQRTNRTMNGRSSARWSLQGVAPLQGSLMAGALASYATEMVDLGAILLASGGRGNRYRSRHHPPAQNGFGAGLESGHPAKRRQECEGMQAIASKLVTDLLATSFMGPYMRPAAQDGAREQDQGSGAVRRQQVFMTLGHWWHAAKFMPRHPDLRDAVLDSVSLKEAYRILAEEQGPLPQGLGTARRDGLRCGHARAAAPRIGLARRAARRRR
jgi:hypothetical protein